MSRAMPATWEERFKEVAKDKQNMLWSIDANDTLVGMRLLVARRLSQPGLTRSRSSRADRGDQRVLSRA